MQNLLAILLLALFALSATALKKPDFSGTWNFDESQSKQNAEFSWAPVQLNINQEKKSISIERVSNFQGQEYRHTSTYTLDGEESVNQGFQGEDIVSIAKWTDDKKSISITTEIEMQDGGTLTIISIYSMKDGQINVESNIKGGPMGDSTENWVYTKE